ncbi:MAG: hypothetical protein ACTSSE_16100 [Candidatus Thorarchaeota archaeon]
MISETKIKEQYGQNLIDSYLKLFHRKMIKHSDVGQLTLHIIIGQLPSIKKMRIHFGDKAIREWWWPWHELLI